MTRSVSLAAVALMCFAFGAFGQTVQFTITSSTSNNLGGVYTDPYNALINGVTSLPAFCDDFSDNVSPPQTWTALVTDLSQFSSGTTVSSVYYTTGALADQTQDYIAAAILAAKGLQYYQTNPAIANEISFAEWAVFDTALLSPSYQTNCSGEGCLGASDLTAANQYLSDALALAATYTTGAAYELASGNHVLIYTPTLDGTSPQGTGTRRPQEFITVTMPEPSSPSLLALYFLGLGCLVFFCRRRVVRAVN
jgi:hypothetical protein